MNENLNDSQNGFSISKSAWRYYLQFYRRYYRPLLLSMAVSAGQSLLVVPIALLIKYVFDKLLPAGNFSYLVLTGGVVALLYLSNSGATLWTRYITLNTTKAVIQEFRDEILKRLYSFSRTFYTKADLSRLHTIMVQDTERLDVMTNALIAQLIPTLFVSLVVGVVLLYLNWFLFLVLASCFPLFFLLSKTIGRKTSKKVHAFHRSFETFSKGILFVLKNMDLTRIQAAEELETGRQRANIDDLRLTSGKMAWIRTAYVSAHNVTIAVAGVIILVVGGRAVINGSMSLGELLSFYAVVAFLRPHLYTISTIIPQVIEGNESLNTLYKLLETNNPQPYFGTKRIPFAGKIAFESVSFSYEETPILREINLDIHQGATVGIFGPNGSGKTTIANLILGFYRPLKGRLLADDSPYSELDIVQLRRHMGVVTQSSIIFPGTIWENITYGCPEATRQEVVQAAEFSSAHEFIQRLDRGYDSSVGEDGVLLSGGQGQRIAIARALLRRPKLLILDEPTNHLDVSSVRHLMNSLKSLDKSTTVIILSHDENVIQEAEYIYVLREGRIVSSGTYPTLAPQLKVAP